ncbi:hypothetical protein FHY55_01725 [Oceanicola sp. D3]|uniref:COG4223 family protein n=1 Tax=Oceanicola sp. D3 TaxID=2587163 RepID=UPI001123D0CB|nr:hypothetical protein [Oceanicola sp. D3]QDC08040.1 hypothetical protein FHY55_01725 [Oceanicola sp. D3]
MTRGVDVAGSDDKPEDEGSEAEVNGADTQDDGPDQKKDHEPDTAADAEELADSSQDDTTDETADEDGEPGDAEADENALTPVEPEDSPSGDAADPDATLEIAEPLKFGPTEKGADSLEAEAEAEATDEVPDLSEPPEPEATPTHAAAPPPAAQKASVMPLLFGGIIAGLIGFAAAWALWGRDNASADLTARLTQQEESAAGTTAALNEKASSEDLAALEARVAELEAAPAVTADTSEIDAAIAEQADALAALSARMEALEKAPVEGSADPASQAALAAYGREVEALRKEVAEQMSEMNAALEAAKETEAQAAARQEEAAAAAARAEEQRALLEVQQALDTGAPYAEALARITSAEIPEGLAAHAEEGVMTLDALKASFPAAARGALRVSREETASEDGGGFGSWLTRQVGARSLEPKEGDDPDAVLSRAEAALNGGDLSTALEELAALPEGGQQAMDQWIAQASRRNDAVTGAQSLSATLTSN